MSKIKKFYKSDLKKINNMLGERDASLVIHTVATILESIVEDRGKLNLRNIEITINDFFSRKFDFETESYIGDENNE